VTPEGGNGRPNAAERVSGQDDAVTEPMTPERWDRTEDLLLAALELPEAGRGGFLSRACAGDDALRLEVESLLAAHASSGPADRLADTLGALLLTDLIEGGGLEGETVGRYEIGERLGRGGMSIVYRAWDPKLERHVALKFLPGLVSSDEASRQRLLVEAQMAAGLEHRNICTIHEIGEAADGRLFIAMPFYDGETLRSRLEAGPLGEKEAVRLALQAARGLATAHERGVIHRDIKPGNLVITRDGTLKILDFGIAQPEGGTDPIGRTPGTAHYMSPEQVAGGSVDARSDLWSLGVVLYEMLAGRRPFEGRTQDAVRHAVAHEEEVPLATVLPGTSPDLQTLTHALLQKDPSRRPGSAAEVAEALRHAERHALRRIPGRRVLGAITTILAGVALAVAVSTVIGHSEEPRPPPPPPGSPADLAFQEGRRLQRSYQLQGGADTILERSVQLLSRAVDLAPEWAEAHAELARAYHWLASGPPGPRRDEYNRRAKTAALEAIRLDEETAGGHAALAFVLHTYERDWAGAEREYERALELEPNDSYYRWGRGLFGMSAGRFEEAAADLRRAQEHAPRSAPLDAQLAWALACAGRYQEAQAVAERWGPDDPGVVQMLGRIALRRGEDRRAVAHFERAAQLSDRDTPALAAIAEAYAIVGRDEDARALVPELEARGAWIPQVYAALGEPQRALDQLEWAYDQRHADLLMIRCRAAALTDLTKHDILAREPRMQELLRRIDFPD
jgi:serine/threonine protein kinase/Flp pilus assembly protein TadD